MHNADVRLLHEPNCSNKSKPRTRFVRENGFVQQYCEHCNAAMGYAKYPAVVLFGNGICAPPTRIIKPERYVRV